MRMERDSCSKVEKKELGPLAGPILQKSRIFERHHGGSGQQNEFDHQKCVWFRDVQNAVNRLISYVCKPTGAKMHPRILLKRQKGSLEELVGKKMSFCRDENGGVILFQR